MAKPDPRKAIITFPGSVRIPALDMGWSEYVNVTREQLYMGAAKMYFGESYQQEVLALTKRRDWQASEWDTAGDMHERAKAYIRKKYAPKIIANVTGFGPVKLTSLVNIAMKEAFFVRPYTHWMAFRAITSPRGQRSTGVASTVVQEIYKHRSAYEQYELDDQQKIVPFCVFYEGVSPSELRKLVGKSVWRQMLSNSRSRNVLLANALFDASETYYSANADPELRRLHLQRLFKVPSSLLKKALSVFNFHEISLLYHVRNARPYTKVNVRDLADLASMSNGPLKDSYSLEELNRAHDARAAARRPAPAMAYRAPPHTPFTQPTAKLEHAGVTYTRICNQEEASEESGVMRHCLGVAYGWRIEKGKYAAYKVDGPNGLRATLGMVPTSTLRTPTDGSWGVAYEKRWNLDQLEGPSRSHVDIPDLSTALDKLSKMNENIVPEKEQAQGKEGKKSQAAASHSELGVLVGTVLEPGCTGDDYRTPCTVSVG